MAYVPVGPWVNGAIPPISAANLDHVETQYTEAVTALTTHAALLTGVHGTGALSLAVAVACAAPYTGNDGVNTARAHGLGRIPKLVVIARGLGSLYVIIGTIAYIFHDGAVVGLAVTAMDATNFYVGNATSYVNSANANAEAYYWAAIG